MEESILSPQWRKNNISIFAKKLNEKLKTSYIVAGITIIIALIAMYIIVDRLFQSSTIILCKTLSHISSDEEERTSSVLISSSPLCAYI